MDHIYPTKDYKVYKIRDEIGNLSGNVLNSRMPTGNFDDIAACAGVSQETLKKLSLDLCNLYEDYGENSPSGVSPPFSAFPLKALELNCVKTLRETLTFKEPRVKEAIHLPVIQSKKVNLEAFKDSVLTLRFYEPFRYSPSMKNHPRFHQEYKVLGSNLLSEFKDKFYCPCSAHGPFFDQSENPNEEVQWEKRDPSPGFLFIHDTFYNDTRNPENHDYSEVILKWFQRFDYVHKFDTKSMQDTRFDDLQIRIGYPCVYQHHGACEHVFCITSVDLLDNSHSQSKSDYPKLSNSARKRSQLCEFCSQIDATHIVTNCPLHVKDPVRVCSECFMSFHYNEDGSKTCEFNAYRIYSVRPMENDPQNDTSK